MIHPVNKFREFVYIRYHPRTRIGRKIKEKILGV